MVDRVTLDYSVNDTVTVITNDYSHLLLDGSAYNLYSSALGIGLHLIRLNLNKNYIYIFILLVGLLVL